MNQRSDDPSIDTLSRIAIGYLVLPGLIFLLWFFKPWIGLPLAAMTIAGCWYLIGKPGGGPAATSWPMLAAFGLIAAGWSYFGGAGHFVYANSIDWMVRDALLHDLIVGNGLPAYDFGGEENYILRAPLAYDLPAAVAGKITGLYLADKILWAWTAAGTFLFLALLPIKGKLSARLVVAMIIPVIFGGADIVGFMFPDFHWGALPFPHTKLDWWLLAPPRVAYFAHTTQLFWSPHHVIPGWLATALLYRHFQNQSATRIAMVCFVALPLWSPLTWLGAIPLLALPFLRRENLYFSWKEKAGILALAPGFLVTILYLTLSAGNIEFGPTYLDATRNLQFAALTTTGKTIWYAVSYLFFVIIEFGILAILVRGTVHGRLFYTSLAILLMLPTISLGPFNDLAMRASIPSLTILCIAAIRFVQSPDVPGNSIRLWGLYILLAFSSVTSCFELYRATTRSHWQIHEEQNLVDVLHGSPEPHYMIRNSANFLGPLMRETSIIPNSLDYSLLCKPRHPAIMARKPFPPGLQRGALIPHDLFRKVPE